jgi:hypothetical protein
MEVHKKQNKKRVKRPKTVNYSKQFKWTSQRKQGALLLSTGLYNQKQVCEQIHITEKTMCEWKQNKEFMDEIDKLTFKNELATRAGLLRLAFAAIDVKKGTDLKKLENDKDTVLDYAEFIVKMLPEDTKDDDDALSKLCDAIMNSAKMVGK